MLLEDRVALITGASRGIGRGIAHTFAREGARLILAGSSDEVHVVAAEIIAAGGQAVAIQGDLASEAHHKELIKATKQHYQRLDVLVNNAGEMHLSRVGMTSLDSFRRMLEINVVAPFNLLQYATRLMQDAVDPNVINLASIAGTRGMEGVTAYSASKGAVVAMTLAAAKELAPRIRVNAIAPGFIESRMTQSLSEEWRAKRVESIRLKRIGTADDVANSALFLASNMASYLTGLVLGVDGGMTS